MDARFLLPAVGTQRDLASQHRRRAGLHPAGGGAAGEGHPRGGLLLSELRETNRRVQALVAGERVSAAVDDIGAVAKRLRGIAASAEDNIGNVLIDLREISMRLNGFSQELATQFGGNTLRVIAQGLRETIAEVRQAAATLPDTAATAGRATRRADAILAEGQQDLNLLFANLSAISQNLRELTESAKRYPSQLLFGQPRDGANRDAIHFRPRIPGAGPAARARRLLLAAREAAGRAALLHAGRPPARERGRGARRAGPGGAALPRLAGLRGRELVFAVDGGAFRTDFYNVFFAPPAAMVGDETREWLERSGLFRAAVASTSQADADYALEGSLTAIHGAATGGRNRAILEVQFLLIDVRAPNAPILSQRRYRQEEPVADGGASALAAGLDRALAAVLMQMEADLAPLVQPRAVAPEPVSVRPSAARGGRR